MTIYRLRKFEKDSRKLPPFAQKKLSKVLLLLCTQQTHPSLQVKKMVNHLDIYEARIDIHYRMTFQLKDDLLLLRRVGGHEIYKNP